MSLDLVVVGLGYVGMPLAQEALRSGLRAAGYDINQPMVERLNEGVSHVDDIDDQSLGEMLKHGFHATTDASIMSNARAIVICVPTPLSDEGGPDLSAVTAAARTVGSQLTPGTLVVLESTTYPGTTDDIVRPILEAESKLTAEEDFYLAFSPERVDPGNALFGIRNTPKVVGGLTPATTERAASLYRRFVDTVVCAKGIREAETAKLLENTYRHVNIALVNEMAQLCHELRIDLWDVIRLAATKPFGFQAFYPGVGVGGHCIPIDPNYLGHCVRSNLGHPFRFVELAQEINAMMPAYVARRAQDILNEGGLAMNGATILLLGVTYKANIADQRESPAIPLARALLDRGALVEFHDPRVTEWRVDGRALRCVASMESAVANADLTILVQNHREYDLEKLPMIARRFFDTKGMTSHASAERL